MVSGSIPPDSPRQAATKTPLIHGFMDPFTDIISVARQNERAPRERSVAVVVVVVVVGVVAAAAVVVIVEAKICAMQNNTEASKQEFSHHHHPPERSRR